MPNVRTSIEKIRRQDLVEAAYHTFLEFGLSGMTMARIGERAGMSHGIVNYYFKSKDMLLSAVVRKANFLIMQDTARRLRLAQTQRQRLSAIIAANFAEDVFTRNIARSWVSYYAAIGQQPDFERLQNAVDKRLTSNLLHAMRDLCGREKAIEIARGVAILIDGLWLRHAKSNDDCDATRASGHVETYVDQQLGSAG